MAPVTIYTTRTCPYCHAAKRLLGHKGVQYQEIDVTGDSQKRAWLAQVTGRRTVPQVFIGEHSVGGYDDISELDADGELDRLLAGESPTGPGIG